MAGEVRLFEHDDFTTAVTAASEATGLPEQFVEKDYYITEVLRLIAHRYGGKVIFKGGTSLSKGYGLIDRLSEDVDLLVVRNRFQPELSKAGTDTELLAMRDLVGDYPGLAWREADSRTFGGSRRDVFAYGSRFEATGLAPTVMTEPGQAGGDFPTELLQLDSHLAKFVRGQGQESIAEDTASFAMTTLHFRRTFVEKLFVIHALVERLKEEGQPLGRDARHYYDLHALAAKPEIREMLESGECDQIKAHCQEIGLKFFAKKYKAPPDLAFRDIDGLFPPAALREQIERDYDEQCRLLCFGSIPPFSRAIGRLEELRELL